MPLLTDQQAGLMSIGTGIKEALGAYYQAQDFQQKKKDKEREFALQAKVHGLMYNPDTGEVTRDAESKQQMDLQNLNKGFLPYDQTRDVNAEADRQRVGGLIETPEHAKARALELAKTDSELKGYSPEVQQQTSGLLTSAAGQAGMNIPKGTSTEALTKALPGLEKFAAISASKAKAQESKTTATNKQIEDLAKTFADKLDADAGRSGNFGDISKRAQGAQRLKALALKTNGEIKNLTDQEQTELAMGAAAMLAPGGVASDSKIAHLVPQSAVGDWKSFLSYWKNQPEGKDQQDFTKRILETINREADVSKSQMDEIRNRRLVYGEGLKKLAPDRYQMIVDKYGMSEQPQGLVSKSQAVEPKGLVAPKAVAIKQHPQDDEAIAWAKANPKDPRAIEILKANGVQ